MLERNLQNKDSAIAIGIYDKKNNVFNAVIAFSECFTQ